MSQPNPDAELLSCFVEACTQITYNQLSVSLDRVREATGVAAIGTQDTLLDVHPFRILKPGTPSRHWKVTSEQIGW